MVRKLASYLCIALLGATAGCSSMGKDKGDGDPSERGTIQLEAAVAPGIDLDKVDYAIEAPGHDPIKGSLPVAEDGTLQGSVESIPAVSDVKISLSASNDEGVKCEGGGTVDVEAGKTTSVAIILQCRLPDGTPITTGDVSVKASFNVCPQLLSASAQVAANGSITVTATASDLDQDALSFTWSAAMGSFADETTPSTTYACTGTGSRKLTATVTDSDGCAHSKDVTVTCPDVKPTDSGAAQDAGPAVDAGGGMDAGAEVDSGAALDAGPSEEDAGSTVDSGSSAEADAGSTTPPAAVLCEGTPANACEECACSSCTTQMDACKAATGTAAAGAGAGKAKSALCEAVVRCGQAAGCRGTTCYCGTADLVSCLTGMANGPCMPEIQAAAETDDVLMIQGRQTDVTFAVGLANAVSTCSENACSMACGTTASPM